VIHVVNIYSHIIIYFELDFTYIDFGIQIFVVKFGDGFPLLILDFES
jgi:hypothetical protein